MQVWSKSIFSSKDIYLQDYDFENEDKITKI